MKKVLLAFALVLSLSAPASACPNSFSARGFGGGRFSSFSFESGGCGHVQSFGAFGNGGGRSRTFFRQGPFGGTVFRQRNF